MVEFNWLGYRTAMKFAVDTKIREKSELERVRGVGNGMRFFFFSSSTILPPPSPVLIHDRRGFIYFYARVSGYVSWLHRYLVNVTVDLGWERILLPNGAGWRMGER